MFSCIGEEGARRVTWLWRLLWEVLRSIRVDHEEDANLPREIAIHVKFLDLFIYFTVKERYLYIFED